MRGLRGLRKGEGAGGAGGAGGGVKGLSRERRKIGSLGRLGGTALSNSTVYMLQPQFVESYICQHKSKLSAFFTPSPGGNFVLKALS